MTEEDPNQGDHDCCPEGVPCECVDCEGCQPQSASPFVAAPPYPGDWQNIGPAGGAAGITIRRTFNHPTTGAPLVDVDIFINAAAGSCDPANNCDPITSCTFSAPTVTAIGGIPGLVEVTPMRHGSSGRRTSLTVGPLIGSQTAGLWGLPQDGDPNVAPGVSFSPGCGAYNQTMEYRIRFEYTENGQVFAFEKSVYFRCSPCKVKPS